MIFLYQVFCLLAILRLKIFLYLFVLLVLLVTVDFLRDFSNFKYLIANQSYLLRVKVLSVIVRQVNKFSVFGINFGINLTVEFGKLTCAFFDHKLIYWFSLVLLVYTLYIHIYLAVRVMLVFRAADIQRCSEPFPFTLFLAYWFLLYRSFCVV